MKKHEVQCHNVVTVNECNTAQDEELVDDIFDYQCNLLNHGLLYENFRDAVAEADGERILRCWRFLLLHFFVDGSGSVKYAIEALYLQFQQKALLSPKEAYLQKWNRSVNHHGVLGKNVAFDLDLEHDNNYLKQAMRKLGPNVTSNSVGRICGALQIARKTIENISHECHVMQRSGKHFTTSSRKDLIKVIQALIQCDAFQKSTEGRRYKCFPNCKRSALHNIDMADLCKWINKHKYDIKIGRTAR